MSLLVSWQWSMAAAVAFLATGHPALAGNPSGSATVTSDYVFRGISQSQADPALQAGVRVDTTSGVYAALWASTVHFASAPDASTEVDGVLGWRGDLSETWVGDINVTRFQYPATSTALSYTELIATLTWRDRSWILLGYSPDVFASSEAGVYAQVGTNVSLGDGVRIEVAGGYYALDEAYGRGYTHAQVAAVWQPHPRVELRLTGHTTDANARILFGDVASPRIEAAIQTSF